MIFSASRLHGVSSVVKKQALLIDTHDTEEYVAKLYVKVGWGFHDNTNIVYWMEEIWLAAIKVSVVVCRESDQRWRDGYKG